MISEKKTKRLVPQPAVEVIATTYTCDACAATFDDRWRARDHYMTQHTYKSLEELPILHDAFSEYQGIVMYFETDEQRRAWARFQPEDKYHERTWRGPGWYTAYTIDFGNGDDTLIAVPALADVIVELDEKLNRITQALRAICSIQSAKP